jgi:uncharacterized protein GlcG (DUF336 family)
MKSANFILAATSTLSLLAPMAFAQSNVEGCSIPASRVARIQAQLAVVIASGNGGLFTPNRMWSAVVDRQGRLCSIVKTGDAWPGSRAIAMAKASTANDFNNSAPALSTANLYSPTQPGGSLYGLNNSNPFNPVFLPVNLGDGQVAGGVITFGGGVPLYDAGKVIGGLGVSGDSACADHVIAYRMRALSQLAQMPKGVGPNGTDDIDYLAAGEAPNGFKHPHCLSSDLAPGTY